LFYLEIFHNQIIKCVICLTTFSQFRSENGEQPSGTRDLMNKDAPMKLRVEHSIDTTEKVPPADMAEQAPQKETEKQIPPKAQLEQVEAKGTAEMDKRSDNTINPEHIRQFQRESLGGALKDDVMKPDHVREAFDQVNGPETMKWGAERDRMEPEAVKDDIMEQESANEDTMEPEAVKEDAMEKEKTREASMEPKNKRDDKVQPEPVKDDIKEPARESSSPIEPENSRTASVVTSSGNTTTSEATVPLESETAVGEILARTIRYMKDKGIKMDPVMSAFFTSLLHTYCV
jgi:hypothetical protein